MVHSKLDDTINYIETRLLEKEDEKLCIEILKVLKDMMINSHYGKKVG